jgi:Ca-activated chloride channel family protein
VGKDVLLKNVSDGPQLDEAFQKISDELRTQYLLAYYPSQRFADSDYRRIQVSLQKNTGYKVRHRTGYYTSKSE